MPKMKYKINETDWVVLDANNADKLGGELPAYYANASDFETHTLDQNNPHAVTAAQAGAETPTGAQDKVNTHALETDVHSATSFAQANRIIIRDANGRAKIEAPVDLDDIARKEEVDNAEAAAIAYTDTHEAKSAPHSGHETTTGATAKADAAQAAAMVYTDDHEDKAAPHLGHELIANRGVADGYASLDSAGTVPSSQIKAEFKEIKVVEDIAGRDALIDTWEGMRVHVKDASADTDVDSGWGEYLYDGANWTLTAQDTGSLNLVQEWTDIEGRPNSTPTQIDSAVDHRNLTTNPHGVTAAQAGAETPAGAQAKADTAENAAKAHTDTHAALTNNPHGTTKSHVGLGNVENKSSSAIRSEISSSNISSALGYTPASTSHSHSFSSLTSIPATASRWPSWGEVSSKPSTFNPSSHNHSANDITSGHLSVNQGRRASETATGVPQYHGHGRVAGRFYGGSTTPTNGSSSYRMNFDGLFRATKLYEGSRQVVAYGSNSNGWYLRFADGVQICWEQGAKHNAVTSYQNQYWNHHNFTFPASFTSIPVVNPSVRTTAGICFSGVRRATSSTADIYLISQGYGSNGYICYEAIGRWY